MKINFLKNLMMGPPAVKKEAFRAEPGRLQQQLDAGGKISAKAGAPDDMASGLVYRMFNQPLLISPDFIGMIARAIETNTPVNLSALKLGGRTAAQVRQRLNVENGTAIIEVYDYLSYRFDPLASMLFGNTSYEDLRVQFLAALSDPNVKNIVFDINSPGGELAGLFDLVDEIYQARGQKPVYAVFNHYGYSAAFAIASAADRRYISRTGRAGSVGVVAMHIDQSGWDAKNGLVYTPIYAGTRKVDFSQHAPLSSEAMAIAKEKVDDAYSLFVNTAARNLGMTQATVRATEAAIYMGKKAVKIGFATSVMPWHRVMAKLGNKEYGGVIRGFFGSALEPLSPVAAPRGGAKQDVITKADAEKLVKTAADLVRKETYNKGWQEGIEEGRIEGRDIGKKEKHARAVAIMEICALAGMALQTSLGYLKDPTLTVDDVRAMVIEDLAANADKTKIRSTVSATSTGGNLLLAKARERAGAAIIRKET